MEHLDWGLKMTVLGMGLVFALLALLWGLLTLVLALDKEEVEALRMTLQVTKLPTSRKLRPADCQQIWCRRSWLPHSNIKMHCGVVPPR